MMRITHWHASRGALAALALATGAVVAAPAYGQADEARLRKIEAEVRALQRLVFPSSDGRFFTPEVVTPNGQQPARPVGLPSETAVSDILVRLDAMEVQLARATLRGEEASNSVELLQTRIAELEARVAELEAKSAPVSVAPAAAAPATATPGPTGAITVPTPSPTPSPTPAGPSSERLERVKAILKPQTEDAGDDEYTYGFRLWDAKLFPEAQQQLKLFVDKYPTHSRVSFGRNLLGRAYLDDAQPRTGATYFLENYQKDPNGARAPDSLLYLAETMIALKDDQRACRSLAEFSEKYPALATGRLKDQYEKDRKAVTCR